MHSTPLILLRFRKFVRIHELCHIFFRSLNDFFFFFNLLGAILTRPVPNCVTNVMDLSGRWNGSNGESQFRSWSQLAQHFTPNMFLLSCYQSLSSRPVYYKPPKFSKNYQPITLMPCPSSSFPAQCVQAPHCRVMTWFHCTHFPAPCRTFFLT